MARELRKIRERRRTERIRVALQAQVRVRSLGSPIEYKFSTTNVSIGGVYLKGNPNDYCPFTAETLLETFVTLKEDPEVTLAFMGKIAHTAGGGFGVKIVQIEDHAQKQLNEFVRELVDSGAEIVGYPQDTV